MPAGCRPVVRLGSDEAGDLAGPSKPDPPTCPTMGSNARLVADHVCPAGLSRVKTSYASQGLNRPSGLLPTSWTIRRRLP